jgi:hypothetical protein
MGGEVLVLGIIAMFTWLIPFFGLPIPIIGLVWGIMILRKRPARKGMPVSGVVLSSIGLFLSVSYSVISLIGSPDFFTSTNAGGGEPPPPAGPVDWKADGKIEAGEYDNNANFGANFQVYWKTDTQFVYFGLSAPTTGWMSIGFINDLRSGKDMDVIIGTAGIEVTSGKVMDMWSATQPNGTLTDDTELGGQLSLLEWAALEVVPAASDEEEDSPSTVIEFRRRLAAGDAYDLTLLPGPNLFIWSFGNTDDIKSSYSARGYGVIELD